MKPVSEKLTERLGEETVWEREPMSLHTGFRTGGPADIFVMPKNTDEVITAVNILRQENIPFMIMGNGTNLLVRDKGIRGAVIQIGGKMGSITVCEKGRIEAEAGAAMAALAQRAAENSLTGLEFASGIPGTVGGGVSMNAGAYGGEMKDVLSEIIVLTEDGELLRLKKNELEMGYRRSILPEKGYIMLKGVFILNEGEPEEIKGKMADLAKRRKEKQPLQFPSAGSTFKRPEGYFAGKLIEDAGLKGVSVGGAQVSEKHAGFIINKGNASSQDILELIALCQARVREQFGVELDTEVKIVGEE